MKLATSVIGPFIVTCEGFVYPEYDPLPLPLHELKLYLLFGMAVIDTIWPLLNQPFAGATVPPVLAVIVREYRVV